MAKTTYNVEELKKQHGRIQLVTIGNKEAIICFPSYKVYQQAVAAAIESEIGYVETIVNNCIVDGDENLAKDSEDLMNLREVIGLVTEPASLSWKKEGSKIVITLDGEDLQGNPEQKVITLKPITREHLNLAERKSKRGAVLTKQLELLKMLLLDGDSEFIDSKDMYWLIPVLSNVEDLYKKKEVSIKKL
jgi:hypothetical protein